MLGRERDLPPPGRSPFRTSGPHQRHMEAASIPAGPPASQRIRALIGTYGLIARAARPAGRTTRSRTSATTGTWSAWARTSTAGISNGAIWALVAIGYTLVYGIVELINFAHGEVFMIGSFISASFIATLGLHQGSNAVAAVLRAAAHADRGDDRLGHAQRDDRAGRLQTPAQRAEAGAADHRRRLLLHPAERRPALEGRLSRAASPTSSTRSTRSSRSSASRSRTPTCSRSASRSRC